MSDSKKGKLHPRNRHQGHYDFKALQTLYPELRSYVVKNHASVETIDFANPVAVKLLNRALLKQFYGIAEWEIPENYLCPPIPGRADYVHHLADLLATNGKIPRGKTVRVMDIGTGANCIYPIIGVSEYGWSFVGTDIDSGAIQSAKKIVDSNPTLKDSIEIRAQVAPLHIFKGVIREGERFDVSMSNPPFHASAEEADEVNKRKWRNLGKAAVANFGGRSNELWCKGGEVAFITTMIEESVSVRNQFKWFTAFISKEASLPELERVLKKVRPAENRIVDMAQGQKKSRFIAWRF